MNFKPDITYEGLLIQAQALCSIVSSLENMVSYYLDKDYKLSELRLSFLEKELEYEKNINEILTTELQEFEKKLNNEAQTKDDK